MSHKKVVESLQRIPFEMFDKKWKTKQIVMARFTTYILFGMPIQTEILF